jgi:hypothetical protein
MERLLCRLLPLGNQLVQRLPDNAGFSFLGVADLAGVMDVLTGEADVGGGGNVPVRNVGDVLVSTFATMPSNLTPFLRRVVLVGEPALGLRFDFECIGLGTVDRAPGAERQAAWARPPIRATRSVRSLPFLAPLPSFSSQPEATAKHNR